MLHFRPRSRPEEPDQGPPGFADFATARYPALVRLGTLLSGDAHHGEDLAQMGLVAVLRAWPRLHPAGDPEAYARVAMTRLAARAGRRRWRGEVPTATLPDTSPAARPDADAALDAQRLLAALPAPQRLVLVLRFWLDLSEADTAEALGCSVGTVKSRTSRALGRLRTDATAGDGNPVATAPTRRDAGILPGSGAAR
ncbi:RNA polymerase sigma-70 factor (sigma-E family) [Kineococcus xinjiangensis]|uniref:RNA polymerase sigma-70 factor (Sigma-E family) n=1 Tax=Kineococcus xinjiangensis TaxID=512762 RepID=A0A2S6IDQ1_9ACTN|nr:SigE family RNA polymerase sigma factor [Kineococcus xinjiangensis]PPK92345.1 RNA polymerase sigma-70 factor (sigma-E family) [Kineococcus xinjiangensis]